MCENTAPVQALGIKEEKIMIRGYRKLKLNPSEKEIPPMQS
jgi:hypothetical protein